MDLKRNYCSNIQPPTQIKANPLLNPLITISNASTPVRTRIVKPGSQLNSTPVNVHKIGVPVRSPALYNKQNDQVNCQLAFKKAQLPKHSINLSPIMALNRKMSEGPKSQQRSFTPTSFKRQQSMAKLHENNNNQELQNQTNAIEFGQTMKQSKSSNGFKSMLQSRSKTPTRTAFAETLQRQSSQGNVMNGLRVSGSAQSLLQGISPKMRDSKCLKLGESRSFQQLINIGTPVAKDNEVLCSNSNEHEKKIKAKYKVLQQPDDEEILVYCSKCAINLVQKGFKVQDLTPQDIQKLKRRQLQQLQQNNYSSYSNQYVDYAQQTNRKIKLKLNQLLTQKQNLVASYNKQIDDVQCYYNSILSMVEEQKRRDKQLLTACLQKEKNPGQFLEAKIKNAYYQLDSMIKSGLISHQDLSSIQQIQSLLTQKGFNHKLDSSHHLFDNVQFKFDHFSRFFNNQGKLRIEEDEKQSNNYHNNNLSKKQYFSNKEIMQSNDCPLRFSFEKKLKEKKKITVGYRAGMMNPLEQAPQSMEVEDSNEYNNSYEMKEKKAFRTLFPQDDESQQQIQKQAIHSPTFKQI